MGYGSCEDCPDDQTRHLQVDDDCTGTAWVLLSGRAAVRQFAAQLAAFAADDGNW
jgi:hypothetical protein